MIPLSYNVRSILRRRFSAFATAFGLGLVVFVFAAVLMLARGVEETLKSTGVRENAIVLRKGSTSELTSFLPREGAKTFAGEPWARKYGALLIPQRLMEITMRADQFGVPFGTMAIRLAEVGGKPWAWLKSLVENMP